MHTRMRMIAATLMLLMPLAIASAGLITQSGSRYFSAASPGGGEFLFHDDFSTGDLTHTENGVEWGGTHNTAVVADAGNASGYSLRFRFSDPGSGSSFGEQRFHLGALYTELWIEYRILIPANYQHTDGPSSDNNKWFRLWSGDTSDGNSGYTDYYVKQGYSLIPEYNAALESELIFEFGHMLSGGSLTGVGRFGSGAVSQFIAEEDYGTEMTIVMHFKIDTSGAGASAPDDVGGNGVERVWKNGVLVGSLTTIANTPQVGTNGWNMGYLMGADNSDFHGGTEITDFYVREFTIAESNIFGVSE